MGMGGTEVLVGKEGPIKVVLCAHSSQLKGSRKDTL